MTDRLIHFVKMQGVGNDFAVVSAEQIAGISPADVAIQFCERRFGIGADGLLIIGPSSDARAAFSFHMHNPDGTPDMCGNGLRCAVLYARHIGLVPEQAEAFLVETVDGLLQGRILSITQNELTAEIRVEMAVPRLTAAEIPFTGAESTSQVVGYRLAVGHASLPITALNTGSTHSVVFADELPPDEAFLAVSPGVENHPDFPERTSLMWAKQTGNNQFSIRIWERGAGETLGCGTGACAVAGAAILTSRAQHGVTISVASKGGTLLIDWPKRDSPMWLTGPAEWVFAGDCKILEMV